MQTAAAYSSANMQTAVAGAKVHRIGAVSYLNTKPLIEGLDARPDVQLLLDVPARLIELLAANRCDVALLPVIDYQRRDDLVLVPATCIGSDGPAMTVAIFSRGPVALIRRITADPESHSSNALARILLAEAYQCRPDFVDDPADADARVAIGDKVVGHPPADLPLKTDLGQAWKDHFGLPFVFAAWMGPAGRVSPQIAGILREAKERGMEQVDRLVSRFAAPRNWPAAVARDYLARVLRYDLDLSPRSPQRRAIELFHSLAAKHGIIRSARPLVVAS